MLSALLQRKSNQLFTPTPTDKQMLVQIQHLRVCIYSAYVVKKSLLKRVTIVCIYTFLNGNILLIYWERLLTFLHISLYVVKTFYSNVL